MTFDGYTVFDTETTGFSPKNGSRIVEFAAVLLAPDGSYEGEWDTLINPQAPMNGSDIHGISHEMVRAAPRFEDVAPTIRNLFAGRVPVAHNMAFDKRFLDHHFAQVGVDAPLVGVCTLNWSKASLRLDNNRLATVCAHAGIDLIDAHAALADTRATAELFSWILSIDTLRLPPLVQWPHLEPRAFTRLSRVHNSW